MSPDTRAHPSQSGRGQGNAPTAPESAPIVVHVGTGEVLGDARELERFGSETLADAYAAIDERMRELRAMRGALDHELVRRLDESGRRRLCVGDYELALEAKRESVWDADELDYQLRRLVDEGVVEASEVVDVVKHETTVSRRQAQRLVDRLAGRERAAVEACRTWQTAGRRTLQVVRSLPLISQD